MSTMIYEYKYNINENETGSLGMDLLIRGSTRLPTVQMTGRRCEAPKTPKNPTAKSIDLQCSRKCRGEGVAEVKFAANVASVTVTSLVTLCLQRLYRNAQSRGISGGSSTEGVDGET